MIKVKYNVIGLCLSLIFFFENIEAKQNISVTLNHWTMMEYSYLQKKDSLNRDRNNDGNIVADLGLNLNLSSSLSVNAVIRINEKIGDRDLTANGRRLEFRQLMAKGSLINKNIIYKLGDFNTSLSPYTLYNSSEELFSTSVNTFDHLRKVRMYENFYYGNDWRRQGLELHSVLKINETNKLFDIKGSLTRNAVQSDLSLQQENIELMGVGHIYFRDKGKYNFGTNIAHTFSLPESGEEENQISNYVMTFSGDYKVPLNTNSHLKFSLETGFSNLVLKNTPNNSADKEGKVLDFSTTWASQKENISLKAGYRFVGVSFFSPGAQTRRINYDTTGLNLLFPTVTNQQFKRNITLFDLNRVVTNQYSVYNRQLSTKNLMSYDPRYTSLHPYGVATPNREGVYLELKLKYFNKNILTRINTDFAKEAVPIGFTDAKKFSLFHIHNDINLHKIIGWDKKMNIQVGYRRESTQRNTNSDSTKSDLISSLWELGAEINVIKNLSFLFGGKFMKVKGKDFLFPYSEFYELDFSTRQILAYDEAQRLINIGVKFDVAKDTYVTFNWQRFSYKSRLTSESNLKYSINQYYLLFNLNI